MKSVWGLAILFFLGLAYLVWQGSQGFEPAQVKPVKSMTEGKLVAFGDGLVSGAGADEDYDFPSVLNNWYEVQIVNAGVPGDTTVSALARLDKDVLSLKPGLVMILLGRNDVEKNIPGEDTFANLALIIDKIEASGAQVLLLGVGGGALGDQYADGYEELANDKGIEYIKNVLDGVEGEPENMKDEKYPSEMGYAFMADKIAPYFEKFL